MKLIGKKFNRLGGKKSDRGLTLVETVVALAVMAIMSTMVISLIMLTENTGTKNSKLAFGDEFINTNVAIFEYYAYDAYETDSNYISCLVLKYDDGQIKQGHIDDDSTDVYTVYFDGKFKQCAEADRRITGEIRVTKDEDSGTFTLNLKLYDDENHVYGSLENYRITP